MKLRIDIETTEESMTLDSIYEIASKVVGADRLCRQKFGPPSGRSYGNWTYSWDDDKEHALTYTVEMEP